MIGIFRTARSRWRTLAPIVGGLLVSQVLTLFTTPVIYLYMDMAGDLIRARRSENGKAEAAAPSPQPY